jgi:WD40 repeat protein
MASKSAILRLVPLLTDRLSAANSLRLNQTVEIINDDGQAILADVLHKLYPSLKQAASLTAFRQFRAEIKRAAREGGVQLSIKTDGQTRTPPSNRTVSFESENRIVEEVKRMVDAEVGDIERLPQDVAVEPHRFFVSYAHDDARPKTELLRSLQPLLKTHSRATFELWTDTEILPGKLWRTEIQNALEGCDFGLLLVSPAFLASQFITKEELQYLLEYKRVIPVALKPVLFDGTMNLKGLEDRQIFFDTGHKTFADRTTGKTRDAFALQLFRKISALLLEPKRSPVKPPEHKVQSSPVANNEAIGTYDVTISAQCSSEQVRVARLASTLLPKKTRFEHHLRLAIGDFDEEGFVHTEGVLSTMSKGLEATPQIDPTRRKDAVEFLTEWIEDEKAPPYGALLSEYGMGKTTTCKALARELLSRREKGERVHLPIYLDLRYIGESAKDTLVLKEILELIIKRSWKSGPDDAKLSAKEIIDLVQHENAFVIWDGLDEVLVHLENHAGQMFTRQLFRILPPSRKNEPRRGRMLISCRTHYFRTLRDQQNHFRAEDRDNVREEDYRAPFVLLPFTPDQIRQYIQHTLPGENPDRVMAALSAVHNLTEMAQRPYTLSLIAEQFAHIEQWKAEGRRVTGLMLYRHMVRSWLERDQGKHQLTPDHKQALMEHFAAKLWGSGAHFGSVEDLEQWLIDFLESHPQLAAHYKLKDPTLLKEDLRTATFLVRDGDDQFRFAHTSLQEYFLAGYLRRALVERKPEAWDLPRISPEAMDFLGQWLEDEGRRDAVLATLDRLRDSYNPRASKLAFTYFLFAVRKGYPSPSPAGFQLPGADLTGWEISGSRMVPLLLVGINLKGTRLWNSKWRDCNMDGAELDDADALRAEFLRCHLPESSWRGAALEATVLRDCEMSHARFTEARYRGAQYLRCELDGAVSLPAGRPQALYAMSTGPKQEDTEDPKQHARVALAAGHQDSVRSCAWSPDGLRIVSASDDHTLRIWDAKLGTCLTALEGHRGSVLGCAWSPDGLWIASASFDKTLRIWDAKLGTSLSTLQGHQDFVYCCAWSPDGLRIVSASWDKTLRIWDAKSGNSMATLQGHQNYVRCCAWSPDGLRIVSASDDKTLRIWDAKSGTSLAILQGHEDSVRGCAWSADGLRIVSASEDKTLRIWNAKSGTSMATLQGHQNYVYACAWLADGLRIVSASRDNTLRIWDAKSCTSLATLEGHQDCVWGCAWSPDGLRIVSASNDKMLRIWDAKSGTSLATLEGHQDSMLSCAWSPDGLRIVSASDDKTLRIWDAKSGTSLAILQGHEDSVRGCAWSADGLRIVSASEDKTLRIWNAKSGTSMATLQGHQNFVLGCAWSPDGLRIVSASADNTLRIWDAKSGTSLAKLEGHQGYVSDCAWSPDGLRILSASADKTLRIWDAKSGTNLATLDEHQNSVLGCAWSPDGLRIASASWDKTLRIWDAKSGTSLATLEGHQGYVSDCVWSPDGRRILSASADKTLRIWDAKSGTSLATLHGHQDCVNSCAWSRDGLRIVSASVDGTLRTWDATTGVEIAPRIYQFDSSWCSIDHQNNKIVACDDEAWRYVGWVVPDTVNGLPEWLPAETFGPLPVVGS